MKYILITTFFLSTIASIHAMNNDTKKKIKIRRLSDAPLMNLEKPQDTPNKRPSPSTEKELKKQALPRRFSNPEIDKEALKKLKQTIKKQKKQEEKLKQEDDAGEDITTL